MNDNINENIENDNINNTPSFINKESDKGTQFSILDNEEKQVKVKQVNREIEIQQKEIELQKEIKKSLEIKKQQRKNLEKKVVFFSCLIVILAISYTLSTRLIRKPFEYKYSVLYLYDLSIVTTKQQYQSHNSIISFMSLAEKNGENLDEASERLFHDLNIQNIYESNKETILLLSSGLPNIDGLSQTYEEINYTVNEYFIAIEDLNELLIEVTDMSFDDYRDEYIKRLQAVNSLSNDLTLLLDETSTLGL